MEWASPPGVAGDRSAQSVITSPTRSVMDCSTAGENPNTDAALVRSGQRGPRLEVGRIVSFRHTPSSVRVVTNRVRRSFRVSLRRTASPGRSLSSHSRWTGRSIPEAVAPTGVGSRSSGTSRALAGSMGRPSGSRLGRRRPPGAPVRSARYVVRPGEVHEDRTRLIERPAGSANMGHHPSPSFLVVMCAVDASAVHAAVIRVRTRG